MIKLEVTCEGILLPVHAQPRGRRNAVLGVQADRLKVSVTEAPEKGKANEALIRVLAETLRLKPAQIVLAGGAASRHKKFLVTGIEAADLEQRIAACIESCRRKPSGG